MSPQVSQPRRRLPTASICGVRRMLAEPADERGRDVVRIGQQMAAGVALPIVERLQDQRLLLGAHPAQGADLAVRGRLLEVFDRADAELAIEHRDGLRTDALQVEQVEDRRRKLGDQLAVELGVAGLDDLADPRGQILADAGNLAKPGHVERRQLVRMVGDDVGAVAVGADLERVVVLDLQQIGDLPEDARNGARYPSRRPSVSMR